MKTTCHKLFGGVKTDEMVTGMAADAKGNVFFAGQATGLKDRFAYDIFYGRINADGTLAWAKLWHGPFRDYSRDPGQNDESGGSANAIAVDDQGYLYLAGAYSGSRSNNNFAALVLKICPETGKPVWEKLWRPAWPSRILDKHGAEAYALDVCGEHVYVTGTTGAGIQGSNAGVFLLSLARGNGSIEFQRYVDPKRGYNDRGYAVRADGKGNVYVGGLTAKYAFLLKFSGTNLAWAKEVRLGWGSSINYVDVDAAGNVYVSCDRRGGKTFFSVLKFAADGKMLWGKTYTGSVYNKNNNCAFVKVVGDSVYAGGRTGQSYYDA